MPMALGDIVLLTWFGHCFGQRIMLTHTYRVGTAGTVVESTGTTLQRIIDAIKEGTLVQPITDAYLACLPDTYELETYRAQVISPTRSAYEVQLGLGVVGTHVSPATVANDSAVICMRTALAGRNQVANKHIGPTPDAVNANGLLTPAYRSILDVLGSFLMDDFFPYLNGPRLVPIIYHRSGGTYDDITGRLIGSTGRVQRRRTVGLGE